ncbi:MAG: glycosyltransferase family 4 protein [Acidobacteriia bacterium]|nr:glycosyltransferase family 4 protein [Terriglobia bacterium]
MTAPESTFQENRIIGLFPELLGVGGIQEAGRLTATALSEIASRHGWSTEFLSLNDPPGLHSFDSGGRTIALRGFGRAKVRFALAAIGRARSCRKDGACIVLAGHPYLAVPVGWMQRACPRLKTVVMSHGVEVWTPLPSFRRRALLRANLVLAPSRDTAQKLAHVQGVPSDRIRRLAWPLSPSFLRMAATPADLTLPEAFPRQGRSILTVGRWAASERYKGTDELIRAIAQLRATLPDLHLVAVGGGDDLPRLRKLAADLAVADCVLFLENLSREEIAACYAGADLFALPSTGEGFGLVFLEAMAFAKPVVGAACGGTTDVVEDGINGLLVPPGDAGALARALYGLLSDESLRRELGARGAEIVRQKHGFDAFQAELQSLLADPRLHEGVGPG